MEKVEAAKQAWRESSRRQREGGEERGWRGHLLCPVGRWAEREESLGSLIAA